MEFQGHASLCRQKACSLPNRSKSILVFGSATNLWAENMDSAVPNNRSWWSLSSGFGDQPVDDKLDTLSSPSEHTLVDDKNIERFGKTEVIDHDLHLLALGVEVGPDGFIQWASGSNDHPRNWSRGRKTFDTTVIILFEFYT